MVDRRTPAETLGRKEIESEKAMISTRPTSSGITVIGRPSSSCGSSWVVMILQSELVDRRTSAELRGEGDRVREGSRGAAAQERYLLRFRCGALVAPFLDVSSIVRTTSGSACGVIYFGVDWRGSSKLGISLRGPDSECLLGTPRTTKV